MSDSARVEKKDHFVVKVETALIKLGTVVGAAVALQEVDGEGPLFVRNKAGTLVGKLEQSSNPTIHAELVAMIKEKGWQGMLGFFHAIYEPMTGARVKTEHSRDQPENNSSSQYLVNRIDNRHNL